ncbi:serine/threonine-protein kinase [Pirellulaceae bacterium SH501]
MLFNRTQSCTSNAWKILLAESVDDAAVCNATKHVESCSECQAELQRASDQPSDWWEEARGCWLNEGLPAISAVDSTWISIEVGSEMPADTSIEAERVPLAFLEPAPHPEMMGRIGRYDVEKVIGTGGMGIVLKAYDTELHRVVAIKVLSDHLANNASARRRFAREAQAGAAVIHSNVIPIYNVEIDGKLPYLVMQCVHGASLQAKVDQQGPLPIEDVLRITKQTAAGLFAAHEQGLVHRDVKPANILLEENVDRVLLSDFGLARAVDDASMTRTGVVAGTPHYMSPEQAKGESIQCESDQFGLGCVVYFMLTGRPPFRAETAMGVLNRICHDPHRPLEEVRNDIPREVCELVNRLLEKEPRNRFPTAKHVEQEVDRLLVLLQSGNLSLAKRKPARANRIKLASMYRWGVAVFGSIAMLACMILVISSILRSVNRNVTTIRPNSDITVRELANAREEWNKAILEDRTIDLQLLQLDASLRSLELEWSSKGVVPSGSIDSTWLELEHEMMRQLMEAEASNQQ